MKALEFLRTVLKRVPGVAWWAIPFIVTEVAIASYGFSTFRLPFAPLVYADPLRPFLIGADLTIAVFAVNFSLFSVQLSVYRNALQKLSTRLISGAVITLLIALVPVLTAAFSERWTASAAVLALPVLTYMAVMLTVITQSQTSAKRYIIKLGQESELDEFVSAFRRAAKAIDVDPPEFVAPDGTPPPVYEMGWQIYPVTVEPDPLNQLSVIASLAADAGDLATYVQTVNTTLKSVYYLHNESYSRNLEDLSGNGLLRQHGAEALNRISRFRPSWDTTGIVAHRFIHACAGFLAEADLSAFPRSYLALTIVGAMAAASKPLIELDLESQAIDVVVVARRVALDGTKTKPREPLTDSHHRHTLAGHARIIQELGETAIANSNEHLLFRCLDALGFLGCSAAKVNNLDLGRACLLGLVQLGRMARKEELPCFWDRCSLTPEDHAEERILWVLTWIPKLDEQARERWARAIAEALSRLIGFETTVSFVESNGELQPDVTCSQEPHVYRINDHGRWRSYDFSDNSVVRELVIY